MSVEKSLADFAASRRSGAIVLQGGWGVGKTYFWHKKIVEPLLKKPWKKRYTYVSLFGLQSLSEVRAAIYQGMETFGHDVPKGLRRFVSPLFYWSLLQRPLSYLSLAEIPYVGGAAAKVYDDLSFFSVRDCLICVDDFERRGDSLPLRDVLGLVSKLHVERNCRVIAILNSGTLNSEDQEVWNRYREKVFLAELTYSPTEAEIARLGLIGAEAEAWYPDACKALEDLAIKNIRIAQRAKRFVEEALNVVAGRDLKPRTLRRIARTLVLLTYASAGQGEGAPSLKFVRATGPYAFALSSINKESQSDQEKQWLKTLGDFGEFLDDELGVALYNMTAVGYPNADEVKSGIDAYELSTEREDQASAMRNAWRLFHGSLRDNGDELVAAFEQAWPPVSSREHVKNLEALARLLRVLGREDLATRFIETWASQHIGYQEMDEVENMFGRVKDQQILDAMRAVELEEPAGLALSDAVDELASGGGRHVEAAVAVSIASAADIMDALTSVHAKDPIIAIKNLMRTDGSDHPWPRARENVRAAAKELALGSALNAARLRGIGLNFEEPPPPEQAEATESAAGNDGDAKA